MSRPFSSVYLNPGAPLVGDRRAAERHPWDEEIALRPLHLAGEPARWACVQNISRTGVGLLLSNPFEPGTVLEMGLRCNLAGPTGVVVGRVVYTKRGPTGVAHMGCAFDREFAADDLDTEQTIE